MPQAFLQRKEQDLKVEMPLAPHFQVPSRVTPWPQIVPHRPVSSSPIEAQEKTDSPFKRSVRLDRVSAAAAAKELYNAMKGGLTGLGTDEAKIFRTLHEKSPREIREISQIYKQHYGRDLYQDLRAELQDNARFLRVLDVVLKGDPIQSSAAITHLELSLPAPNPKLIEALFVNKTAEQLGALKKLYLDTYGEDLAGKIRNTLKGCEADRLVALLNHAPGAAMAAQLKQILDNPILLDKAQIFTVLEGRSRLELQELMHVFYEKYGTPLVRELEKHFKGLDFDRILALLQPDTASANAIKIHQAIDRSSALPQVLLEIVHQHPTSIQAVAQAYEKKFGCSLIAELDKRAEISSELKKILRDWLADGTCPESGRLFLALNAASPNQAHLLAILQNKSPQQISELACNYSQQFKQDLLAQVNKVLPPESALEVRLALSGPHCKIEEELRNLETIYQYERGRRRSLISKTLDMLSPHGRILDANLTKLQELHSQQGPQVSEAERQNLLRLAQFVKDDLEVYKQAKQKLMRLIRRISSLISFAGTWLILKGFGLPEREIWLYALAAGLSVHIISEGSRRRLKAGARRTIARKQKRPPDRARRRRIAT